MTCSSSLRNTQGGDLLEQGNTQVPKHRTRTYLYATTILTPIFEWASITLNSNYPASRHGDANNCGLSCILAVGQFSGGGIMVWPKDDRKRSPSTLKEFDSKTYDSRRNMCFDGTQAHQTEPFTGDRESLVWIVANKVSTARSNVLVGRTAANRVQRAAGASSLWVYGRI